LVVGGGAPTGGIAEMVEHGRNGLAVPLANGHVFAGQVERMLQEPALRKELAEDRFRHVAWMQCPGRVAAASAKAYSGAIYAVGSI
jgi:glycosyltransferase involved in cell wall biosynthesis